MTLRFDRQVAIVTGAGQGLGRCHALALAARGARVVVNDLGGSASGGGEGDDRSADAVVREIDEQGGEAVASATDVTDALAVDELVEQVLSRWGRVDILVNNAGILRDRPFNELSSRDFSQVLDVHLNGTIACTRAVWNPMCEQQYGRVVMTTSASGLFGNFAQANYSAAKMALVGLMRSVGLEGQKLGIKVNCLAPCASTRMTEGIIPEKVLKILDPETVTAGLLHLVGENAPSRTVLTAGAGTFALAAVVEARGIYLSPDDCSPEVLAERWSEVTDLADADAHKDGFTQTASLVTKALRGRRAARRAARSSKREKP